MMLTYLDPLLLTTNGILLGLLAAWVLNRWNYPAVIGACNPATPSPLDTGSGHKKVKGISREVLELLSQPAGPSCTATQPTPFAQAPAPKHNPCAHGLGQFGWEAGEVECFMVACECVVFVGTEAECSDFLTERGMVPLEGAIEPFDQRLLDSLDRLGMGLIDLQQED